MEVLPISSKKLRNLEKINLDLSILSTEGSIYLYEDKSKNNSCQKVMKKLENNLGDYFGNKLLTINNLVDMKDQISIDEIVFPEKLVVSQRKIIGYTMDYIDGINLKKLYDDPDVNIKKMIKYFKQIGEILEKVKKLNQYGVIDNFYLNDIHEDNFMIEKNTDEVKVVDIDSCRISNNKPFLARYLTPFSQVEQLPKKYKVYKGKNPIGYIEPDMNSELYCYTIMILNYLYKDNVAKMTIKEFYCYLDYLNNIGFPYEIIDCIYNLYHYNDNINIKDLLELIPDDISKASYKVYNFVKCGVKI